MKKTDNKLNRIWNYIKGGHYLPVLLAFSVFGMFTNIFLLEMGVSVGLLVLKPTIPYFWAISGILIFVFTEIMFWVHDRNTRVTGSWFAETFFEKIVSLVSATVFVLGLMSYYRLILKLLNTVSLAMLKELFFNTIRIGLIVVAVLGIIYIYLWLNGFKYRMGEKQ